MTMSMSYDELMNELEKLINNLDTSKIEAFAQSRVSLAVSAVILVLSLIAWWKIFKKADKPGWLIFIPFVNAWNMFSVAGIPGIFSLFGIGGVALSAVGAGMVNDTAASTDTGLYLLLIGIILLVLFLIACSAFYFMLSVSFGKGFIYGLLLSLFSSLFLLILAFSKAEYKPLKKRT